MAEYKEFSRAEVVRDASGNYVIQQPPTSLHVWNKEMLLAMTTESLWNLRKQALDDGASKHMPLLSNIDALISGRVKPGGWSLISKDEAHKILALVPAQPKIGTPSIKRGAAGEIVQFLFPQNEKGVSYKVDVTPEPTGATAYLIAYVDQLMQQVAAQKPIGDFTRLNAEIAELKEEVDALNADIDDYEQKIEELESRLDQAALENAAWKLKQVLDDRGSPIPEPTFDYAPREFSSPMVGWNGILRD